MLCSQAADVQLKMPPGRLSILLLSSPFPSHSFLHRLLIANEPRLAGARTSHVNLSSLRLTKRYIMTIIEALSVS